MHLTFCSFVSFRRRSLHQVTTFRKKLFAVFANLSDAQVDEALEDDSEERLGQLSRAMQKQERWMWIALVAASVCLLASGAITLHIYWGKELVETFVGLKESFSQLDLLSSPYWILSVLFFILMGFDYWTRRTYYKRHPDLLKKTP